MTHPGAVAATNLDLEALISDSNRTIATLAITTLLKTGNESSVERLLKQIGSFMSDIADDFKIVVVEAIRSLCLKFPQKCAPLPPPRISHAPLQSLSPTCVCMAPSTPSCCSLLQLAPLGIHSCMRMQGCPTYMSI